MPEDVWVFQRSRSVPIASEVAFQCSSALLMSESICS